jgi:hypothetical protein
MRLSRFFPYLKSGAFHTVILVIALLFILTKHAKEDSPTVIEFETVAKMEVQKSLKSSGLVARNTRAKIHALPSTSPALDLRPSFMKGGLFTRTQESASDSINHPATSAAELANIPFQVITAFDELALQIDRELEFPVVFIENNIQGTAALDLQFDSEGMINETESHFTGSGRSLRGLLVKAARLGIANWYKGNAYRLKPDQFKNQHFHVGFEISYLQRNYDHLDRQGFGNYEITRRRFKNTCMGVMSVDVVCAALKTKGFIENIVSEGPRIRFDLLKDRLSEYDEMELHGINRVIREG